MNLKNEMKALFAKEGLTMTEVLNRLAEKYDWSRSVPNFSAKLRKESLRYREAVEIADVLGYKIVWERK